MDIQAHVLPAMVALHNLIMKLDPVECDDICEMEVEDLNPGLCADVGVLAEAATMEHEKKRSEAQCDVIAEAM
jgi:hypothetical protein